MLLDLGDTVAKIKSEYEVENVLTWHAMAGYWAGVEPDAEELQGFQPFAAKLVAPEGIQNVDPEVRWLSDEREGERDAGVGQEREIEPGGIFNCVWCVICDIITPYSVFFVCVLGTRAMVSKQHALDGATQSRVIPRNVMSYSKAPAVLAYGLLEVHQYQFTILQLQQPAETYGV